MACTRGGLDGLNHRQDEDSGPFDRGQAEVSQIASGGNAEQTGAGRPGVSDAGFGRNPFAESDPS